MERPFKTFSKDAFGENKIKSRNSCWMMAIAAVSATITVTSSKGDYDIATVATVMADVATVVATFAMAVVKIAMAVAAAATAIGAVMMAVTLVAAAVPTTSLKCLRQTNDIA